MKTKYFSIIVLMITFILILGTKVNAVEIEKDKEYEVKQEVEIKALPLIFSANKAKISSGNIKIAEILNDWCKVENSEEAGWIRKNNLKDIIEESNTPSEEEQKPEENETENNQPDPDENNQKPEESENTETENKDFEVKELNKTGYVKADGLNVRKEPSTSSESLHSYSFNAKIKITGEVDGWYRINYDGEEGYVSSKYVSDEKLPESTRRGGVDRKIETTPINENEEKNEDEDKKEEQTTEKQEQQNTNKSGVTGEQVVSFAKQYLGYKYVSGGASPSTGFDCSGFTTYVFKHFGISLNRSSSAQIKNGISVQKSNLQLGDILIFNNEANTAIGHVGIYIGNGTFIHAANHKDGVKITSLSLSYYAKRYVGARRVI